MSAERAEFCDTNVLVYAYDLSAGVKRLKARSLLDRLWESGDGALSIQVLQELFVTLTRKVANRLSAEEARGIVGDMSTWTVVEPTRHDVLEAIDNSARWSLSFWDAMMLTAARRSGASVVWSENLKDGERYDGMVVRNPFVGKDQE